jgi:hypothetical protein
MWHHGQSSLFIKQQSGLDPFLGTVVFHERVPQNRGVASPAKLRFFQGPKRLLSRGEEQTADRYFCDCGYSSATSQGKNTVKRRLLKLVGEPQARGKGQVLG